MKMKVNIIGTVLVFILIHSVRSYESNLEEVGAVGGQRYSLEEKEAIKELRYLVKDVLYERYMFEDAYLINWLRAHHLDVEKANQMLRRNLEWRKEENIDNLINEEFPQFEQDFRSDYCEDKVGDPVLVLPIGSWKTRRVAENEMEAYKRYWIKVTLEMPAHNAWLKKSNHNSTNQYTLLVNADGYTIQSHACMKCLEVYYHYVSTYENYYPLSCKNRFVVNAPFDIKGLVQLVLPWFSSDSISHLHIYGKNQTKWEEQLSRYISREEFGRALLENL